jgi:hypothetical protein
MAAATVTCALSSVTPNDGVLANQIVLSGPVSMNGTNSSSVVLSVTDDGYVTGNHTAVVTCSCSIVSAVNDSALLQSSFSVVVIDTGRAAVSLHLDNATVIIEGTGIGSGSTFYGSAPFVLAFASATRGSITVSVRVRGQGL